ncbi:porin [Rhodoplanes sp. SY1]|uniref:porin n=1 Tax=Rhodoplanes sp. SY1 TaxID=3166646 RepID=UPI0038B4A77F
MKMVKTLLLGSAAGLVAIAGAQAADLPVKAKPVEYVKVCSLYGAGFYYIPGTDTCVKIGGYVRAQYYYGNGSQVAAGVMFGATNGEQSRSSPADAVLRTRAVMTMDSRTQTEWGTLRTYYLLGFTDDNGSTSLYATRGFIQFAGFTFGKAQSFYDIFSNPAVSYFGFASSDTGDAGTNLAAYTAQLGNGVSATIAAEGPRTVGIFNTSTQLSNAITLGNNLANDSVNVRFPDVVANIRVDQAWGSFQVMGALHDASAAYNFQEIGALGLPAGAGNSYYTVPTSVPRTLQGNGDDALGWAVGVGARVKTDFISRGDSFQFQVNYTEGATRYAVTTQPSAGSPLRFSGNSIGAGWFTDGIYTDGGSVELVKVLGINASYEHVWTPALKTSVYGAYIDVDYGNAANTAVCNYLSAGTTNNLPLAAGSPCDMDFSFWQLGSRTQWNVRPDFYMGVDVLYTRLNTALEGANVIAGVNGPGSAVGSQSPRTGNIFGDQDALAVTFRVHRDIVP